MVNRAAISATPATPSPRAPLVQPNPMLLFAPLELVLLAGAELVPVAAEGRENAPAEVLIGVEVPDPDAPLLATAGAVETLDVRDAEPVTAVCVTLTKPGAVWMENDIVVVSGAGRIPKLLGVVKGVLTTEGNVSRLLPGGRIASAKG